MDLDKCELFDTQKKEWKQLPNLNKGGRYIHSSCAFNQDTVYVFCGSDGSNYLNSIERHKLDSGKWDTITTNQSIDSV